MNESFRLVKMLGAVSFICGLIIVSTHINTLAKIKTNQETIMRESVSELLPGIEKQVIYGVAADGAITPGASVEGSGKRLIAGYDKSGKLLGVVLNGAERGYGDMITAMYAYSPEQKQVIGLKIVEMKETPGLGDKIAKDKEFLENFKALDAAHPITAVKHGAKKNAWEIDAISGATISSRAIGRLLAKSVQENAPLIERNLDRIRKGE